MELEQAAAGSPQARFDDDDGAAGGQLFGELVEEAFDVDSPALGVVELVDDHRHPHECGSLEARQHRELLLQGGDGRLDPVLFSRRALFEDLPGDPESSAALIREQIAPRTVCRQGQEARDGGASRARPHIRNPLRFGDRRVALQEILEDADRAHRIQWKMVAEVGQAQARIVHIAETLEMLPLAGEELEELLKSLALGSKRDLDLADLFLDRPQQGAGGSEGGHGVPGCWGSCFVEPAQQVWPKLRVKRHGCQRNYRDGAQRAIVLSLSMQAPPVPVE